MYGVWPYCGNFQLHGQFWLPDHNSLIRFSSCESWRLSFQNFKMGVEMQTLWEVKVKILLDSLRNHIGLFQLCYTPVDSMMMYTLWTHFPISSWHMSFWCAILTTILAILPHKYRCLSKESDHIRTTYFNANDGFLPTSLWRDAVNFKLFAWILPCPHLNIHSLTKTHLLQTHQNVPSTFCNFFCCAFSVL